MSVDDAKQWIGKRVVSRDAGDKMIREVQVPHGPYYLLHVTKGGMCVLQGREGQPIERQVPPSLLEPYDF